MSMIQNQINREIDKLPALPTTVMKVLEVCKDPNLKPSDLNRVISLDPVLTGAVLKLINSAYYAITEKVSSIVRAIIMLGLNTVKNLALTTSVMGQIEKSGSIGALDMEGFWRHCIGVGVTAKKIAMTTGVDAQNQEEYFVAGLLHDIGKIVLNKAISDDYLQVIKKSDTEVKELLECERAILQTDHIEVGRQICQKWNLTSDLEQAIIYHHSPFECNEKSKHVVYAVYVANIWCNQNSIGFSGNMGPKHLDEKILQYLKLKETDLYTWENEIEERIASASIFLKINRNG